MSFFNKTYIFIRKLDETINILNFDKSIICNTMDSNFNNLYSINIIDGDYSFVDVWFEIDSSDNIYGILNNKKGKLLYINIKDKNIEENTLLKYDYKNFFIKFPFIKIISNETHAIYYSMNKNNSNLTTIVHIYMHDNICIKNSIDLINYNILTNFIVTWDNNIPTIFYFKVINGFEELFFCTYDLNEFKWLNPIQMTNSQKNKIYLSVINNDENFYHIVFSENNDGKYYCAYLNAYIRCDNFKVYNHIYISSNIMCLFPNLIEYNSILYAQWVEYFNLYTCKSIDNGKTWTQPIASRHLSISPALIYQFKSNFKDDRIYNLSSLFTFEDYFEIDKLIPKY
ncbi:hypothetical protein QOZ84_10855 [Romboutsia sedimentorum]|uniref:Exo-alpha-sialidase n=1 Tax=Romboutsia sedimentorum TaxID=1368474 RepID=A0ABT7EAV9_9FIRM|nr:hypothetical protein [Romboutsia sedimentorum]MDK2564050.1 hypothetical protein [Romboutsia sedimentorum]